MLALVSMTQQDEVTSLKSELAVAEAKLELFRSATPYLVYIYSLETGRVEFLNRNLGAELGYCAEEIEAMGPRMLEALVHPEDYARFPELVRRWSSLETEDDYLESEFRARHKDGTYHAFLGRDVVYERSPDGSVHRFLGTAIDITERKLLEQRLREGEKLEALGRMASSVAHDFNNLVAVVLGSLSLVERQLRVGGSIEGHLAHVRTAAEQAAMLTSQLLEFARPGRPTPAAADLEKIILDARSMLEHILAQKGALELDLGDALPEVAIDGGALVPVLVNLVVNARDALGDQGTVTIRTRMAERTIRASAEGLPTRSRYVLLSVEDDGEGIPKDILAHIFEPFFTTKHPGRGTGLGLANVYATLKRIGGEVAVDSAPGSGSRFDLYLPIARSPASR